MIKSNGGIIGPDNVTTGGFNGVASGVFKLSEATKLIRESKWPVPSPFTNTVPNSVRFNRGSSDYLNRTPSSASNRKTFTFSFWVKRTKLAIDATIYNVRPDGNGANRINFHSGDSFRISLEPISKYIYTTRLFRDVSAWYHIVVAFDTTQGTAANRVKLYVNGVQETSFSTATYPDQNTNLDINTTSVINLGRDLESNSDFIDMYLAEFVFIDGQQLTPTSFGETNSDSGIWIPKIITGLTFGTNGYYLKNANAGALGTDSSGQSNNFTVNNLTSLDQSTDSPSNNFATWNSLQPTNATMTEGNLVGASSASSGHYSGLSTIGVTSGKWYFECKQIQESTTNESIIGVVIFYNTITALLNPEGRGGAWGIKSQGRGFQTNSSGVGSTTNDFIPGFSNNETIGIALDIDNSKIYFSEGGEWNNSGSWNAANPTTSQTLQNALGDGTYFFFAGDASGSNNCTWSANFGSPAHAISSGNADANGFGNFEYAPPTGYFSLCTNNLNILE